MRNNLKFKDGSGLASYLERGLNHIGVEFEDAELQFEDKDEYIVQPLDFEKAKEQGYISLESPQGYEVYYYDLA